MMKEADLIGLTAEQAERSRSIEQDVAAGRDSIVVWHRLLERRRLDRARGLHPITEFAVDARAEGEHGALHRKTPEHGEQHGREPFYVTTEHEARGLLIHCVGYLSNAEGDKLAFDKGVGGRDKMAEWIIKEINDTGALAYIRRHTPHVFGIPLAVPDA
jgi:hypothetical protein